MFSLSFVIPAYNEAARLERCIASIRKEAPGASIFVVDNNSTDDTREIALDLGAVVLSEPKQGITHARQCGLFLTNTKWVAFIDADSELMEGWLVELLDHVTKPGVVGVSGPVTYPDLRMTAQISTLLFYSVGWLFHQIMPMMQGGNFVVNREAMIKAGGFDTSIEFYGEDTAIAMRLSQQGKIIFALGLLAKTSARRMQAEGWITIGLRYAMNYFWMWTVGRPWTKTHRDHRESDSEAAAP